MRVKASRFRSSWILNRFEKALANDTAAPLLERPLTLAQFRRLFCGRRLLFRGLPLLRRHLGRQHDHLDLAAGLLDLLLRRAGEFVGPDGDGRGQVAVAEDLEAVLAVLD